MNAKTQYVLGFLVAGLTLYLGATQLASGSLFFRLIIGLAFGYALMRSYMGFAGSVNRAYNTGSTKLMRVMTTMFLVTSILMAAVFLVKEGGIAPRVSPVNLGLIFGAILFGYGMTFSSCCASGTLTDIVTETPKALITLFFFMMGVFFGFAIANRMSWVNDTVLSSGGRNGVFFPDWFAGDGLQGYAGAIGLTAVITLVVVLLSYAYEKKRKKENRFFLPPPERRQANLPQLDVEGFKLFSWKTYEHLFATPWRMETGAFALVVIYVSLSAVTGRGWGVSSTFGIWFAKLLMLFGFSAEQMADFTLRKVTDFSTPFFQHAGSVQNFGILLGTWIYMLTSGQFWTEFKGSWKIRPFEMALFVMGGFTMGFGTRFAKGCNAGAMFVGTSNFSLSGWVFFVFVAVGAIIAGGIQKKIYDKMSQS